MISWYQFLLQDTNNESKDKAINRGGSRIENDEPAPLPEAGANQAKSDHHKVPPPLPVPRSPKMPRAEPKAPGQHLDHHDRPAPLPSSPSHKQDTQERARKFSSSSSPHSDQKPVVPTSPVHKSDSPDEAPEDEAEEKYFYAEKNHNKPLQVSLICCMISCSPVSWISSRALHKSCLASWFIFISKYHDEGNTSPIFYHINNYSFKRIIFSLF